MKWYAIIFWFGWLVPSLISAVRLWVDKDRGTVKEYLAYVWWAIVPVWNLVLIYFVIKEIIDFVSDWYRSRDPLARILFEFCVKIWLTLAAAYALVVLFYKILYS